MIEIVDTSINSLPYGTASQTENAILKVLSELELLREETRQLREENQDLREKIAALETTELQDVDRICIDIAQDRQRISRLEHKEPMTTDRTKSHVDELHRLMIEEKTAQVSILKASRLLGISKERMRQLKPLILADGRFEMGWSTVKGKKAAVIRIRKYL